MWALAVLLILVLLTSSSVLAFLYFKSSQAYAQVYNRIKSIVDIEQETQRVQADYHKFIAENNRNTQKLRDEFQQKRAIYDALVQEVNLLEENLEDISYGIYKPHFDYDTSEKYKEHLNRVRDEQKQMLRAKKAAHCPADWVVQGSKKEGKKMVDRTMKLMLRAFNGECDSCVAKVRIPTIPPCCSEGRRPVVPKDSGRVFRVIAATCSE